MKKVLILYGKSKWENSKPFENERYQYSYEYFYNLCKKNDIQMYRASYQWYDYKKNVFKNAWIFEKSNFGWKKVHNIEPDLIYDKTKARLEVYYKKELINKYYPFINDTRFTQIIDDKFITGLIFKEWSKESWSVNNLNELKEVLPKIKSKKVVIKPISESGGKDVWILDKKDVLKTIKITNTCIVQEFIDSSKGVPKISKGMHDLRVVMVNEVITYAYIREPQAGSFLANLAQGGSLTIVPVEKLPRSIFPVIKRVFDVFRSFPLKVYSIDFMFDEKGKPWIVELNSMPGMYFSPEEKPYMIEMYKELLKTFKVKLSENENHIFAKTNQ